MAQMKSNFKVKAAEIRKYADLLGGKFLADATAVALDEVGFVAVRTFMRATTVGQAIGLAASDVVTVRTGRLAGSIVGNFRFSETTLPSSVEKFRTGQYNSSNSGFGGGRKESIREVKVRPGGIQGIIGSKVKYAARHEFGFKSTPARPYLRPAVKVALPSVKNIYRETLTSTFQKADI